MDRNVEMVAAMRNRRNSRVAPPFADTGQCLEAVFIAASETHRLGAQRVDAGEAGAGPREVLPPDALGVATPHRQFRAAEL